MILVDIVSSQTTRIPIQGGLLEKVGRSCYIVKERRSYLWNRLYSLSVMWVFR